MSANHLLASILGFAILVATAAAADWPCYLGANRDLTSAEKGLKLWAGDAAKVLWKKNVGQGHSSVVVAGKHLYTQGAGTVWCMDAETGDVVWTYPPLQGGKPAGGETTATPAVADGQVFALNSNGMFLCLDCHVPDWLVLDTRIIWAVWVKREGPPGGGPLGG